MIFVDKVRSYNETLPLEAALDRAIEERIKEHVLEEFLKSQKAKVKSMSVLEFNLERQLKFEREEGREEGVELSLISLICKKIQKGKSQEVIADELEADLEWVSHVCEVAKDFAPEYDEKKIYEVLRFQVA